MAGRGASDGERRDTITVRTIGYQGYGPEAWLERLLAERVELVVDVRELPRSRRPGFSKKSLSGRLGARGIDYLSVREMGAPPELRVPLRTGTLPFSEFAPAFRELLKGRRPELAEVTRLAESRRIVLLCWEEDPHRCHRSLVAEAMRETAEAMREAAAEPSMRRPGARRARRLEIVHLRRDGTRETETPG